MIGFLLQFNLPCTPGFFSRQNREIRLLITISLTSKHNVILSSFAHQFCQVNRRQFKCDNCRKPCSEELDFVASKRTYTKKLAQNILEQLKEGDILNVSRRNDVTEEEIQRMLEDMTEKITYQDLSKLKSGFRNSGYLKRTFTRTCVGGCYQCLLEIGEFSFKTF